MPRSLPEFLRRLDPGIYFSNNYVVLDFEVDTSHGDYGNPVHPDNQLLLASYRLGPDHPASPKQVTRAKWGSEFEQQELISLINHADFIVAQNAKYELGWLRRAGLDLRSVLPFDTMLAEYVLLGNLAAGDDTMAGRDLDLDTLCRRRGLPIKDPVVDILIKHGINPVRIPRPWLEGRCRQDVETTEAVFLSQRDALAKTGRLPVLYTRCLLTPVLADVEPEGMALDPDAVTKEYNAYVEEFDTLSRQMETMTGGINWRSTKQVAEYVYDTLKFDELRKPNGEPRRNKPSKLHPQGSRLTDKKTLEKLRATTQGQKDFIALRQRLGKVNAALTKALEFFMGVVAEHGGIFYGEFNQANTATHRLSSSGIEMQFEMFKTTNGKKLKKMKAQFQNMPRVFKKLFRAKRTTDDGRPFVMFDPDGSQIEFRVAAFLGQDEQAMKDIADKDWDAHVTSASEMEQVPYEKLYALYRAGDAKAAKQRQDAKPETFKPLYGGEKGTPKQERWYRAFRKRYPGIAAAQERWASEVARTKRLITPWGLRYYWPYAKINQWGSLNVKTAVYNYPVQALATAEIIPIAIVYLWHRLAERGLEDRVFIVNTVHDSVPCEVHPDVVDDMKALVKQCFTMDVYGYLHKVYGLKFNVPLGVGIKAGTHWGEGKEEAYNVWPDGREERAK